MIFLALLDRLRSTSNGERCLSYFHTGEMSGGFKKQRGSARGFALAN